MAVFLEIKRDKDFNNDILPKIDALAAEQNKIITDIIRDILYASSSYKPRPCSCENANKVHIEEQKDDRSMKRRRILVAVDMVYYFSFYQYIITLPGRLERNCNSYLHQTLYHTLKWKCQIMALQRYRQCNLLTLVTTTFEAYQDKWVTEAERRSLS